MENKDKHFDYIFWYVAAITAFGAGFSVFCMVWFEKEVSERFADVALIFWLSTGVSGGIGYLLGSSASKRNNNSKEVEVSGTIETTTKKDEQS
jgi:hypothetical protein